MNVFSCSWARSSSTAVPRICILLPRIQEPLTTSKGDTAKNQQAGGSQQLAAGCGKFLLQCHSEPFDVLPVSAHGTGRVNSAKNLGVSNIKTLRDSSSSAGGRTPHNDTFGDLFSNLLGTMVSTRLEITINFRILTA